MTPVERLAIVTGIVVEAGGIRRRLGVRKYSETSLHNYSCCQEQLTSIGIAREVAGPGDVSVALVLARGDGIDANRGDGGRVRELRLGRDDAVGDVVVDALRQISVCSRIEANNLRSALPASLRQWCRP
jgi:hypothetical protein